MNHLTSFDRGAILLMLCLISIYMIRPKLNNLSSKLFQALMISVLVASLTEIASIAIINDPLRMPMIFNQIIIAIYLFSINICSVLYYRYVIEVTAQGVVKKYEKNIFGAALLLDFIVIAMIPFTEFTVYFDENNVYQHGPLFNVLYVVSLSVLIAAGIRFYKYRKTLNTIQRFLLFFFYIVNVGAIIIEQIYPNLNILTFVTALFMFLVYASLQNPEYYMDSELGCYNEEAFIEICEQKINNSKKFIVISFYADAYDYVNQVFGIERGQDLATYVSNYFLENFKYQNLFHISDCNFVYIASHKTKYVKEMYKKVWHDFDKTYEINNAKISLQPRGAAIVVPGVVDSAKDILDAVNFSKNKNIQNNTDELCFIDSKFLMEKRRKERIAQIIKEQISEKGFELRYLPILDVKRDQIVAAEALVRLFDEELGEIKPNEFIDIAEEYGLIYDIDKAIFSKVCEYMHRLEEDDYEIERMQINLSTLEIMQGDSVEYWLNKMRSLSIDSSKMNFEVKESICKEVNSNLLWNMEKLKSKGCTFAIDNYGIGFSNVIDLLNMGFETVNIDRSILWEAMNAEEAMCILENIISMFKELDYKVLITGVENREQFELAKRLEVDFIKGYIISRPVQEEEFTSMLKKKNETL